MICTPAVCKRDGSMFYVPKEKLLREWKPVTPVVLFRPGKHHSFISWSNIWISEWLQWRCLALEPSEEITAATPALQGKYKVIKVGSWDTDAQSLETLWKGRKCTLGPLFWNKTLPYVSKATISFTKICSLVIITLSGLWKAAQNLTWHLHVTFQSHLLPQGDSFYIIWFCLLWGW